uniref:Transmembrane 9 superfamily member n=1 Tax=Chromera velia CCMP2878 TaxID=1169474 RepID=A0A0G4G227_9ALVE|eukprot:Cvel_19736.t1-p1 / transcript=Cvel_19736.t1 / gene=Cvel_19736 / organism=Chromera_velia_CCMP2878 / gene_product=Transmembrane 9 superfamily member 3, putative / transcript_product=Transmembrane 9 superfamily member 3, putative / location=Cvel_scaffold1726:16347-25586(+) / protein_length=575 / sequence_SO=supercontig / SO=protein_coding / is_pseudo=false
MRLLWIFLGLAIGTQGDEKTHRYDQGEAVVVWGGKVGPYHNPHETYTYDSMPLCDLEGVETEQKSATFGEALAGHNLLKLPKFQIKFGEGSLSTEVCTKTLSNEDAESLSSMIDEHWYTGLHVDELPLYLLVGFAEGAQARMVFTHREFVIAKNEDRIISVDVDPSSPVQVSPGASLRFTYGVRWVESSVAFEDRFQKYLEEDFFEDRVHWFSIVNSLVVCGALCFATALVLSRTLRRDFQRQDVSEAEELECMDRADESGWKQVHGDVFRRPDHLMSFATLYSAGAEVISVLVVVLILAPIHAFHTKRGVAIDAVIGSYIVARGVGGFAGGRLFKKYGGSAWKRSMLRNQLFLPTVAFFAWFAVHWVARMKSSSSTGPSSSILFIVLFLLFCAPVHVVGTLLGRRSTAKGTFPCRVHTLRRPIPPKHFLWEPAFIAVSGAIPFACVYIEMYFIFSSMWGYKFYYVYGFACAILCILTLVIMCVAVTGAYILLNAEDYRWVWLSFLSGGSTAVYIWLYSLYYLVASTKMTGVVQLVYYNVATAFGCLCLGLACGTLSFAATSLFVHTIYRNIKSD